MNLNEFVKAFASEFENTSEDLFTPKTIFKQLDEWDSLTVLSIIALADEEFNVRITSQDLRDCNSIEDTYNLISSKQNV
ncbi:MAG TPA: acyl carrier protein [Prolixibacteraceae bacterium]|nr:acyl carrier protein [Prolixibacteraceae bacterium]